MDHEDGVVSLWIQTDSEDALEQYMTIKSEDGESILSQFQRDFDIPHVDDDYREARCYNQPVRTIRELLDGHSDCDVIIPRFERLCGEVLSEPTNCAVLLYDFRYDGSIAETSGGPVTLRLVGTVSLI